LNWKTDVFAVGFKEKKKIVKQEGRAKKKRNVLIKTLFRILYVKITQQKDSQKTIPFPVQLEFYLYLYEI